MQTFLPHPLFSECAKVLDNRRLNKQLVEVTQIARAITDPSYGWQNHPAVNMWRGNYDALIVYGWTMYGEWKQRFEDGRRGGKREHKSGEWIRNEFYRVYREWMESGCLVYAPDFLGNERLHSSHRACLLAKDIEHYSQFGWAEKPTPKVDGKWPYWWPQ